MVRRITPSASSPEDIYLFEAPKAATYRWLFFLLDDVPIARANTGYDTALEALYNGGGHYAARFDAADDESLTIINATPVLWAFARKCALSVIHLWAAPEIVQEYLQFGNETIRVAALQRARNTHNNTAQSYAATAANYAAMSAAMSAYPAGMTIETVQKASSAIGYTVINNQIETDSNCHAKYERARVTAKQNFSKIFEQMLLELF